MTKDEIRKQIAASRPDFQTLEKLSAAIVKKLQILELFQKAKTVGVYMPLPDEVDVTPLFGFGSLGELALPKTSKPIGEANSPSAPLIQHGKTFNIPTFDEAFDGYRLAQLTEEVQIGKFGIPEPKELVFAPETLDIIIVPGVAFDHDGNRIGRGGGFYDRLLPQYRALKIGVCFEFQCLENIPFEPHDRPIDLLITESKTLKISMNY